jgi:hypothetical protein
VEGGAEQVHYISGTVQESWMRGRWREELNKFIIYLELFRRAG